MTTTSSITSRQFGIHSCLQCDFQSLVHSVFLVTMELSPHPNDIRVRSFHMTVSCQWVIPIDKDVFLVEVVILFGRNWFLQKTPLKMINRTDCLWPIHKFTFHGLENRTNLFTIRIFYFRKSLHDLEKVLPHRIVMLHSAECFVHDETSTVHSCVKHIPPWHEQGRPSIGSLYSLSRFRETVNRLTVQLVQTQTQIVQDTRGSTYHTVAETQNLQRMFKDSWVNVQVLPAVNSTWWWCRCLCRLSVGAVMSLSISITSLSRSRSDITRLSVVLAVSCSVCCFSL